MSESATRTPPRVTIDSNVVLDAYERGVETALTILSLHPDSVRVQVANRTPHREATEWAQQLATLQVGRVTNVFRLGMSPLGGPDVLAGDEDVARIEALQEAVFPRGLERASGIDLARVSDVDILDAHLRSGAEYFVTSDEHFLKARPRLEPLGVAILTPEELVARMQPPT
jgi:hypothetical protein